MSYSLITEIVVAPDPVANTGILYLSCVVRDSTGATIVTGTVVATVYNKKGVAVGSPVSMTGSGSSFTGKFPMANTYGIGRFVIEFVSTDRKSTRLNSSHIQKSRMPSSA